MTNCITVEESSCSFVVSPRKSDNLPRYVPNRYVSVISAHTHTHTQTNITQSTLPRQNSPRSNNRIHQIRPGRRSSAEDGRVPELLAQLLGPGTMLYVSHPTISIRARTFLQMSRGFVSALTLGCCGLAGCPGSWAAAASCGMLT